MDWDKLYQRKIPPKINLNEYKNDYKDDDSKSISNNEEILFKDIDYNENNQTLNRVKNYTYIGSPRDNPNSIINKNDFM